MRIALLAVALLSLPVLADGPIRLQLTVGEEKPLCRGGACHSPICDNPSVAQISADARAVLRGIGPGITRCSVNTGYGRQVYEIEVTDAAPSSPSSKPPTGS